MRDDDPLFANQDEEEDENANEQQDDRPQNIGFDYIRIAGIVKMLGQRH